MTVRLSASTIASRSGVGMAAVYGREATRPRGACPCTNVRAVRELAITAIGADRPGIVAALTEALLGLEGNLEDCRAALLRGSFAMVMVVAVPDGIDAAACQAALAPVADRLGLRLWTGPAEPPAPHPPGELLVISVYGADHPGIVHGVASTLSER